MLESLRAEVTGLLAMLVTSDPVFGRTDGTVEFTVFKTDWTRESVVVTVSFTVLFIWSKSEGVTGGGLTGGTIVMPIGDGGGTVETVDAVSVKGAS